MKKIYSVLMLLCLPLLAFATSVTVPTTISPTVISSETTPVTVTFAGSAIDEAAWGTSTHTLYLWAWYYDAAGNVMNAPSNGTWAASSAANTLTYNAATDTYSMTITPSTYFGATGIGKIGFLIKNSSGSYQSQDTTANVGFFFVSSSPKKNSTSYVSSASYPVSISASSNANWTVTKNGTTVYTQNGSTSIFYVLPGITGPTTVTVTAVEASAPNRTITETFYFDVTQATTSAAMPSWMRQGINYDPADPTKVGLALYAPGKTDVVAIGSFNNWAAFNSYKLQRDTANPDVFWTVVTGLTPQQVYTFQYLVNNTIKVADPFSRMVLSPDDDQYISATTFPNLPAYPNGQQYDVSVVQTGMPAYNWTVTNFTKPAKQKLTVYELLLRDFTSEQNWQSAINKIPYLKSLGINAVELMPVMEFDGNNSWGYNTGFHYALDKAYGTPEKFKEFIDTCHQNGIAIILDIALNHATGRSPIERLWSTATDYGYGAVATNNPYFNVNATHSYGVFNDFNHSSAATKYYVKRVLEQWISEYKVDGFRWDLTKGFTQACSSGDETCTNAYQQDRVDILKTYADYQWSFDPDSYIIFEHLGTDPEEQQWANYRVGEGKGVMMWDKLTDPYNQNTMGFATNSNFNRVDFKNHGFSERRNMSYGESHDEERIMFKNVTYGATNGTYDVKNLANSLERQKAYGAVFLTVPGPKMIWQFAELGYDLSIFRCTSGVNNFPGDADGTGDCKLDPKPSAFTLGYDSNASRTSVKDVWAKILAIKLANQVFDTTTFTVNSEAGNLMPRIYIWNDAIPATSLKNVVVLSNFTLTAQNVIPDFPYTGNWYNLMDNSAISVTNTAAPILLQPGEFRIFGNAPQTTLGTSESNSKNGFAFQVTENPATNSKIKVRYSEVKNGTIALYDLSGKILGTQKTTSTKGDQTLDYGQLSSGTYLLQLKSDSGNAVQKVIVK